MSEALQHHELQHNRLPCCLLSPGVCSNSCALNRRCYPTILSSVALVASCPQSFQQITHKKHRFCTNVESESESHSVVSDPLWPHGLYSPWNSPGENTRWVNFPFSRGSSQPRDQSSHIEFNSNPGSYHQCMGTHVLSHLGYVRLFAILWTIAHQAPLSMGILQARILDWVAMPSSRGSSWPRDWTLTSYVSYVHHIGRWVLYH